ncbi:MAG TPA: hypothetical protein VJO34_04235 [Methylomirabilota bacterium]|nr:hypothetical protein [Methylomirabilota bacterium]
MTGSGQRPQDTPARSRGQEPVGLAAEGPPELLRQRLPSDVQRLGQEGNEVIDQVLGQDPADQNREQERECRRCHGQGEEPEVVAVKVRHVPADVAHERIDNGRHGPLHHFVADVPNELSEVERVGLRAPGLPEEEDIVDHAFVPTRVLPNDLLLGLREIVQLQHRRRRDERASHPQRVPKRGVLGGPSGRKPAEGLERVQAHELVVAQADLRAPEEERHERTEPAVSARNAPHKPLDDPDPLHLIEKPRNRDPDEDRRLLDRADPAAGVEPVKVGQ